DRGPDDRNGIVGDRARLFAGGREIVLGHINLSPFSLDDGFANLSRRLAEFGLLIGVDRLHFADGTDRGVTVHVAIEQALVAHFAVAVAIAGLLIEDSFFFRR